MVHRCQILDCGATADFRPSDGIFVRGDDCLISECFAENVTDHGFVLEGCNRSRILDCSGRNCTSIAGMSNDGVADVGDNEIAGITGTCSHLGSFGGMIGAYAFGQGRLLRSVIHNVDWGSPTTRQDMGRGWTHRGLDRRGNIRSTPAPLLA